MSYTESRARYAEVLDGVINDREEVVITRSGHESVVIVSLEDFESLRETAYLMRSPANARRLLDAMERLEVDGGEDVTRTGNEGIGKPEPLKPDFAGYWFRRITEKHRLVYKVTDTEVRIAACRYHYGR